MTMDMLRLLQSRVMLDSQDLQGPRDFLDLWELLDLMEHLDLLGLRVLKERWAQEEDLEKRDREVCQDWMAPQLTECKQMPA